MPPSPDLAILRWLAGQHQATAPAPAISAATAMTPSEVRIRLAALESRRLISGRYDTSKPPRRVYAVTGEGRRAAGISEARRSDN